MSYIAYSSSLWLGTMESESAYLRGNKNFENAERKNNFEVEKVQRKNSVIWNYEYSNSIHVDLNHSKLNQPIRDYLTTVRSLNNSADIRAIEKILTSPVHLVHTPPLVPASPIVFYGRASDPTSSPHDSSA